MVAHEVARQEGFLEDPGNATHELGARMLSARRRGDAPRDCSSPVGRPGPNAGWSLLHPVSRVLSVHVGAPRDVTWLNRSMSTSIMKTPVAGPVEVRATGLVGDRQADPVQHGGTDKAVYAYAEEDLGWWAETLRRPVPPASFGENITVSGLDLTAAMIGEQWAVGTTVLQVTEPRTPCWKLGMAIGDRLFPRAFAAARRPGVMLRVLQAGHLQAGDTVVLGHRPSHGVTAADVFDMYLGDRDVTSRVLAAPELAQHWHGWAAHRTVWHVDEERKRSSEDGGAR